MTMKFRCEWLVAALAMLVAVQGCADESEGGRVTALSVDLITDFIPVGELATARVDIQSPVDHPEFSQRLSVVIDIDDDLLRGIQLAQVVVPGPGSYEVAVVLLDRDGLALARRQLELMVSDAATATVIITRACVGVSCPGLSDEPDESVCLGGRCVTSECAADAESCLDAECTTSQDCTPQAACAEGRCVRGACLYSGRLAGSPGACATGTICDPESGCQDMPAAFCRDGDERACDLQLGVCDGRYTRCDRGVFPSCGSTEYGARYQVEETQCDGLDNDCDGETDEMIEVMCPFQEGVCAGSRRRCAGVQGLLVCDYLAHDPRYEAVEQSCDGVDNDCDGVVDETSTSPTCPLQDGVCARSRARCVQGRWLCEPSDYGPEFELDELSCDGRDNDCDRRVDEALEPPACTLTQGVCQGSVRRCGGNAGFLACRAADYGEELYEAEEVSCDGLDNDCDGMVDESITRPCDLGCGTGVETCRDGEFVECDAPLRTQLRNLSLGAGLYRWSCVDIPEGVSVEFTGDVELEIERDIVVEGELRFVGDGTIRADRVTLAEDSTVEGPVLDFEADTSIEIRQLALLDASGAYSGGGGAACSAITDRGVAAGGGGGARGGAGGRGGGCGTIAGLAGGAGTHVDGIDGAAGCGCTCLTTIGGGGSSGGEGASAPAGSGGGGGAGGAGGDGGQGAFPNQSQIAPGGLGGAASNSGGGTPRIGGGGGGGAGADRGNFAQVCGLPGGASGGVIALTAPRVINAGQIAANGEDGGDSRAWSRIGASGGGGAGAVSISADSLDNRGLISAVGGNGGAQREHADTLRCQDTDGGGGGGGGGGYIYLDVDTVASGGLDRITVAGGLGGAIDCSSPVGQPGETGILCCTGDVADCTACPQ